MSNKIRLGVLCPAEIAFRRFMPALQKVDEIEFIGLAVYSKEERFGSETVEDSVVKAALDNEYNKAKKFVDQYGGKIFSSYKNLVESKEVDAVYIPLPPGLHYKWGKAALQAGKHILMEKPFTLNFNDSRELIAIARSKKLALHENYMFRFHSQISKIQEIIDSGEIGDVRLYRISFGFPMRDKGDFRYNKTLGGGGLMDAGGYTVKYARMILGKTAQIVYSNMNYDKCFDVDLFGSGTLINQEGITVQIAYGMDNDYKCEIEAWGSKGTLSVNRVLTAPAEFVPTVCIKKNNRIQELNLLPDDAFLKSIYCFLDCIKDETLRDENYQEIEMQAQYVKRFIDEAAELAKSDC